MSLVSVGGAMVWPSLVPGFYGGWATAGLNMDADGEKFGINFQATKTGTITKIHLRTSSTNSNQSIKCGLYEIEPYPNAFYGYPNFTPIGGSSAGVLAVDATSGSQVLSFQLATPASVTCGQCMGIVAEFASYTSGNITFTWASGSGQGRTCYPVVVNYAGGVLSKIQNQKPSMAIEMADGTMMDLPCTKLHCNGATNAVAWQSSSNPNERGNVFNFPFSCRVVGICTRMRLLTGGGQYKFTAYDSDASTTVASLLFDGYHGSSADDDLQWLYFTSPFTMTANANYRVACYPTASFAYEFWQDLASNSALLTGFDGKGQVYRTTRSLGGSWTDNATRIQEMALLIDQVQDGAAGSTGIKVNLGLDGGTRS